MEYYIIFAGIIEKEASLKLANAIIKAREMNVKKITIFFSSLGGDINEGFLLASIIQNSKIPIAIHATNHIDSIANVIYLSAKLRTAESYAKFYLHGASTTGSFDERALYDQLSAIKTNNTRIAYFVHENSSLSLQKVQQIMNIGTTISAQKALEYSMVQEILHKEIPQDASQEEIIYVN